MFPQRVIERVTSKWVLDGECWISTYSVGSHGYAQIGWYHGSGMTMALAHRVAWSAANQQDIPDGMTIDHICHVRKCVNPAHLRLLSNSENAADNRKPRIYPEIDRKCRRGHRMAMNANGVAFCRECKNASDRRKRTEATQRKSLAAAV